MLRILSLTTLVLISISSYSQLEIRKNESGKYGFTNEDGQWIIQPIYEKANEFFDYSYTFARLKGKWGLIDQEGKTILPFAYDNIDLGDTYEDFNSIVIQEGKYGMVNRETGEETIACQYDKPINFNDVYMPELEVTSVVYKNKKIGLITANGAEVVPCIYDAEKEPFRELDYGFYLVHQSNRAGVIDKTGKQIVACIYDDIKVSDSMTEILEITKKGKYGLCSFNGKELIAPIYDKSFYFEDQFALVKLKGKFGAINKNGETVVPFTYSKESEAFDEMQKLYEN